jgi:hypothetical protein
MKLDGRNSFPATFYMRQEIFMPLKAHKKEISMKQNLEVHQSLSACLQRVSLRGSYECHLRSKSLCFI